MTQLSTSISPIARGISALPDAASAATSSPQPQPTVSFPEPVAQSELAQIRSFMLDSAVHANRRNTDPAAAEKRSAPRYSLRELNSLTAEEITERMAQVNPSDDRPGWVKALDLIDLPRNFVGNTIADNFLPEAKRMALQRGEFDQAGLAKVYGADLLRAMGVENRAVNAIGGFFVDLFTDPLSWIGGPIGGAKTLGSRGIAEVSTTGRRTLNSAINSIRNGKAVADDVTRKMLDMHIADGIANGVLTEAATNAEKAAYLQSTAWGKSGKLSAAAEKVGLGRFSRGGTLAEDLYRSSGNAKSATEAARIDSVKEWIAKYTTNPGIDLTKGAGGATIGHVPLTTISVTVPSFKVPGIQHRFGGAQELQMAFAKAGAGKTAQAQLIASASKHATEVNNARRAMEGAFENLDAARLTDDADAIAQAQAALDDVVGNFQQLKQTGEMLRKGTAPSVMRANLNNINDIPTLVATMDALDDAMLDVRRAEALAGFRGMAPNPTPKDVAAAKTAREQAAADAKALGLIDKADEFFDSLVDPSRVSEDLADFIAARTEAADNRWRSLFTGTDEDLTRASMLADTFSEGLATAQEIARRRLVQVRSVMNQDERLITEAARHMLGISDRDLGHLPLMSADRAFESLGRQAISTKMARLGEAIGTNLGGTGGTAKEAFRYLRTIVNGSGRRASEEVSTYARQIEKLMLDADVPASQYNTVAELAGLMTEMEAVKQAAIDYPIMAGQMERGTKYGQKILAEAAQSGVLQNEPLRKGLQQVASDAAARLRELGEIEIMQGNLESPLAVYVPNVLKKEAAKRARIARSKGDARAADLIQSHSGPADLDPTKRRVTNMIEFTDDAGNDHRFTIAEALAYASKSRATLDELSITYPQEAKNAERVLEGLQQFVGRFGKDDLSKVPPEELERMLRAESRPAFGSELNDYAADGRLDPLIGGVLTGGDDRRDIFDNNILNIMYSRLQAHEIARAKESFRDVVEPYIVFKVDAGESVATTQGAPAVLSTGEKAKVLADGRIRVGNRNYVQIKDAISKFPENTLFDPDLLLGNIDGAYIPDTIAVQLKRLADTMNPQQIGPIMGAAENITSLFRTSTLMHPSWMATNTIGNTFLAAMSGMFSDPKRAGQYMKAMKHSMQGIIRRNAEHVSSLDRAGRGVRAVSSTLGADPNTSLILNGQQFRLGDLIDEAAAMDVIGQGRAADAQEQMHKMMESLIPSMREQTPQLGALGNIKSQVQREVGKMQAGRSSSTRLQRASDSVAAGYRALPVGGIKRATRAWFQANAMNDDTFRLATFMMYRADGYDAVTAAQKTREGMLNFGDMTSFEQNYLRPIIPFFAWLRASFPAYAVKSIKDPKQLSAIPKIRQGLEELTAGENRLPQHMRPRWLQETMAIQIGTDPETRGALIAGTLIPQEGVITALQPITSGFDGADLSDVINWAMSQTSPAFRVPFELATKREVFSGRDIGFTPGEGDISLRDYMLSQVRPIKEFGLGVQQGKVAQDFEKSPALGVSRAIIGGRFQSGLAEQKRVQTLYYEMSDQIEDLRRAVRRAEDAGNDDQAAKFKFDILATYKRYVDKGVALDSIPKWAREDLAAFGTGE